MTPRQFIDFAILPALTLLPPKMASPEAVAMLVAIALQESRLQHRVQIGGPARGFLQFEMGDSVSRAGVYGVLNHPATSKIIRDVLDALDYDHFTATSYQAIEHNDILAASYGRLLLWTSPRALPGKGETERAWSEYVSVWRPGKPKPETWPAFYAQAWDAAAGA